MRKIAAVLALTISAFGGGMTVAANGADDFAQRVLHAHNFERARLGLQPLVWNPVVAVRAQAWAEEMARTGRYVHSPRESRNGQGENMVRHIAGDYRPEQLVGTFLDERSKFKPGIFPDVSRTGNWAHAGHYSQVIWPGTTELGCGLAVGRGMDYFVCRYAPAGNVLGQPVGL